MDILLLNIAREKCPINYIDDITRIMIHIVITKMGIIVGRRKEGGWLLPQNLSFTQRGVKESFL